MRSLDDAATDYVAGVRISDEEFEQLQTRHNEWRDADPNHDISSCWCCCWSCDPRLDELE
jgi:hypothetical protein